MTVPKQKLILVPIKMTPSEHRMLKLRANWFAEGNLSAWLRRAGMEYMPKKGERGPRN